MQTHAHIRLLGLSLLATACQDKTLSVIREPPAVTVQEPSDGSSFYTGQEIVFKALVQVYDGTAMSELTHQWVSGSQTICISEAVPTDGYATCIWSYDEVGENTVTVTVTDPKLQSASATVSVNIIENTAPTIEIKAPGEGELFATDELIVFQALVDDQEESSENLFVTVSSNSFGEVTSGYATSSGQFDSAASITEVGEHLLTMRVEDSYGRTAQDTVKIEIYAHVPPTVDSVGIDPTPPTTVDELVADVQGWYDPDGSTPRNRYRWFISDGSGSMTEDLAETTDTYPAAKTTKGDLVQVEVTPYNEYGSGAAVLSPTVEIVNSAPTTPLVYIEPSAPQPGDNLYCYAYDATDADDDAISYVYAWYANGVLSSVTSNVVPSSLTAHGDSWECEATPYDGEEYGNPGSDYVTVSDTEAPDAPKIDKPSAYRNDDEVTLTGTCEPDCALTFYCDDGVSSWSDTATCSSSGALSYTTSLTAGRKTSCYADCEDSAGNISGYSATVATEVCDPGDEYEDTTGYGDEGADPIDEWSTLKDDGLTTIGIEANILDDDDEDWYIISASDNVSEDRTAGLDYYNFSVELTSGSATYAMYVYKGSYDTTSRECSTDSTEYTDFMEDQGDGSHSIPSDTRACATSSAYYNQCEDNSEDYYIQIVRRSSTVSSCQGYELEVTNGVW